MIDNLGRRRELISADLRLKLRTALEQGADNGAQDKLGREAIDAGCGPGSEVADRSQRLRFSARQKRALKVSRLVAQKTKWGGRASGS